MYCYELDESGCNKQVNVIQVLQNEPTEERLKDQ